MKGWASLYSRGVVLEDDAYTVNTYGQDMHNRISGIFYECTLHMSFLINNYYMDAMQEVAVAKVYL